MDYLKEMNEIAFEMGILEGKERSEFFKNGWKIQKPNPELKALIIKWEELAKKYLQQFPPKMVADRNLKKQLLADLYLWRHKGLLSYSETVIKSVK